MKEIIGLILVAGAGVYALYGIVKNKPVFKVDYWFCLFCLLLGMLLVF